MTGSLFSRPLFALLLLLTCGSAAMGQYPNLDLDLPKTGVPQRATLVTDVPANGKKVFADLEGPGCIKHIWLTHSRDDNNNRNVIIRIFFDDEKIPFVEAPLGDFFGVMHGKAWYPINTALLSVQSRSGYNCYFPMPFAKSARVEFEAGDKAQRIYCMVDWHSYVDEPLKEKKRFCARWRREFPTQRYGEDFLMMDADGPGQLVGFVYGVRLLDNTDRWSHGGADNIYIDGDGKHPTYLRGIGGEDTFGTSYGGAQHTPGTHLNAEMPYYVHEDIGEARPAQNVVGYRWFLNDSLRFQKSLHLRFGCMSNDICATTYWYQEQPVRPIFRMPGFDNLVPGRMSKQIPRGSFDLKLPDAGQWWVTKLGEEGALEKALKSPLQMLTPFNSKTCIKRDAMHGFLDFGHVHRPEKRGVGVYHEGACTAWCVLEAPRDLEAKFRLSWEDQLVLRVNDQMPLDLGHRKQFGSKEVDVALKKGRNVIAVTLSNTQNFNHGGWAFAMRATTPDGAILTPRAE